MARSKRFYEEDSTVYKAVETIFLFPDEIQRIIAKGFEFLAERDCDAVELMKAVRTLGSEKILGLHKSKRKLRHYDQNPQFHNAMNYLFLMSPESRLFLAKKILELIGFMQDYFKICREYGQNPDTKTCEKISDVYIELGPVAARVFIVQLDEKFKRLLLGLPDDAAMPEELPPEAQSENKPSVKSVIEEVKSADSGMKIKGDIV